MRLLTELETVALNRVQQNFLDQLQSRLLIEASVKLVVVSPLLDLAGFYRSPYQIESEVPIHLQIPDSSEFLFLKQLGDRYASSNLLSMLNQGNDCDLVLQILKILKPIHP